jgi:uncharacterized protein (TIGR01440 family)
MEQLKQQTEAILHDLNEQFTLQAHHLLVVGVSTSEVRGAIIGSNGSDQVAEAIFAVLYEAQEVSHFHLAFQCCEHLNRSLVVSRETVERFGLTEVAAIPVLHAGGAMASYVYRHMSEPVLVESVVADAGIDIGSTLIGMHLKPVAVPLRPRFPRIGEAYVTMAMTRPKLIGGARAVYILEK